MPRTEAPPASSGPRVLVVDGDDGARNLLTVLLQGAGYEVAAAGDGAEALDQLRAANAVLVLLDPVLPCRDRAALAAELQQRGCRPAVPLLVVSAHPYSRRLAAQLGAGGCIEKPFRLTTLLDEVARLAVSVN
jgi:CheY-like chemotaxis protein